MTVYNKIDKYKTQIDKLRPFEGKLLEQIRSFYRVGFTWASNAIEGNTLTESETKVLLEDGLTVGGKPIRDTFETLGHAKAYDFMFTLLKKKGVSEADILTMHKLFYHDIDTDNAGFYRSIPVIVTGSKYATAKPSEIKKEMDEFINWLQAEQTQHHPVKLAAMAHKKFVFIHPFIDGNGRIARLIMNTILIQNGYIPAVIPPILRAKYISLLEQAHTNDTMFIEFIAETAYESAKDMGRLLGIDTQN